MNKLQSILLLIVSGVTGSFNLCHVHTCTLCDRYVTEGDWGSHAGWAGPHAKKRTKMCTKLLSIENCCNRFFQSANVLGPVADAKKDEGESWILQPWITMTAMAVLVSATLATYLIHWFVQ